MQEFGDFQLRGSPPLLFKADQIIPLGRRGAPLLAALLERRGEVMSKDELLEAAWGTASVEEANLSVQIALLRKALGKAQDGADWIVTVSRVGYRFQPKGPAAKEAPKRTSLPSLVVTPFANLSSHTDDEHYAEGIVGDLTTGLARFKSFVVFSSTSAFAHNGCDVYDPQVSREVGADYALQGSVRWASGRLRTSARLIETTGGRIVWARNFDAPLAGDFKARDRIADALAAHVEAQIILNEISRMGERAVDPDDIVHGFYLRGLGKMQTLAPADNAQAIALFDAALEREPDNVAVLAASCDARAHRIGMGWPAIALDDVTRCRGLAQRGLRRPVSDAGALALFGAALFRTGELDDGLALMQRAVSLNPNDVTALLWAATGSMHWGNVAAAEGYYRRALRLCPTDPRQVHVMGGLSRIRMMEGRFDDALVWAQRALQVHHNYGAAHWTRVAANANLGRLTEAETELKRFRQAQPQVTVSSIRNGQPGRANRMAATLEGLELAGLPESAE